MSENSGRISLLCLNLWNLNAPLEDRMNALSAFIGDERPEAIALQEVSPLGDSRLQLSMIPALGPYHVEYFATGTWNGREEGLAIASREAPVAVERCRLPSSESDMGRGLLICGFDSGLQLATTHWAFRATDEDLRDSQAKETVRILRQLMTNRPDDHVVLCGDFNATRGSRALAVLDDLKLKDPFCGADATSPTYSSLNRFADPSQGLDRRIDHVFVTTHTAASGSLVTLDDDIPVSDHYGLLVDLEVPTQAQDSNLRAASTEPGGAA